MKYMQWLPIVLMFMGCNVLGIHPALSHEKEIVIIIPSYNNQQWYVRNLDSVFTQKYNNYTVKYIDDKSSDATAALVQKYINENHYQHKIELISNTNRCGALCNIYNTIHTCRDDAIIILLDGDDWFKHENVLAIINQVYQDPNIWLTYGSYVHYPYNPNGRCCCIQIPPEIIKANAFREYTWVASHLRTFYAWLFKKVSQEDLLIQKNYFPMAWDLAFMFPMLEMCGERFKFIPEALYIYNIANPLNDSKKNEQYQLFLDNFIRSKPKYNRLEQSYSATKDKA